MARKRLLWQLFPSYLVVCVVATVAVASFAVWQFREFYLEATREGLEARAKFISFNMRKLGWPAVDINMDRFCKNLGEDTNTRITVVDEKQEPLGDSHADLSTMLQEAREERPEIQRAVRSKEAASATRVSGTTGKEMIYVALPVVDGDKVLGVVRTGLPISRVDEAMRSIYVGIGLSLVVVAAIVGAVSLVLSRRVSRPLEKLTEGARRFADGQLDHRLEVPAVAEAASLAETLNQMAARLAAQVRRLEQLELARRDFVANVSHELRTPITPIRAAVESLRHGALHDPAHADHFLAMIARQADRLAAIIEDLLRLSRIEEYEQGALLELQPAELRPVVEAAASSCEAAAAGRQMTVCVDCPDGIEARVNPPLFENALVNLIDNAIKYSQPGQRVWVNARRTDNGVEVDVRDEGCGIEVGHQPRLFERFYRVDKARSRNVGGTGLGLSIVKHIVQLHGGSVSVISAPDAGSTFTIHLPAAERPVTPEA